MGNKTGFRRFSNINFIYVQGIQEPYTNATIKNFMWEHYMYICIITKIQAD